MIPILTMLQVKCPDVEMTEGLKSVPKAIEGRLGEKVHFECTNGNALIGASEAECLATGHWDHPIPACQDVVCPNNITQLATSLRPNLRVQVYSYGAGGHAFFSCQRGHTLEGVAKAKCLKNGEWSVALLDVNPDKDQLPTCKPVICPT